MSYQDIIFTVSGSVHDIVTYHWTSTQLQSHALAAGFSRLGLAKKLDSNSGWFGS